MRRSSLDQGDEPGSLRPQGIGPGFKPPDCHLKQNPHHAGTGKRCEAAGHQRLETKAQDLFTSLGDHGYQTGNHDAETDEVGKTAQGVSDDGPAAQTQFIDG